jgi:hypothetical protein
MKAFAISSRPAVLSRPISAKPIAARRASLLIVAQGKGGEEGGKAWDKSVYGRVGASGNFSLLANAIAKVGHQSFRLPNWIVFHACGSNFLCISRSVEPSSTLLTIAPSPPLQCNLGDELMGAGPFTLFAPGKSLPELPLRTMPNLQSTIIHNLIPSSVQMMTLSAMPSNPWAAPRWTT